MTNLYGTVASDRSKVSRTSSDHISTTAETGDAIVRVDLFKNGSCMVTVKDKTGHGGYVLWEGNIDEEMRKSP
jgi:hypothetical protein